MNFDIYNNCVNLTSINNIIYNYNSTNITIDVQPNMWPPLLTDTLPILWTTYAFYVVIGK